MKGARVYARLDRVRWTFGRVALVVGIVALAVTLGGIVVALRVREESDAAAYAMIAVVGGGLVAVASFAILARFWLESGPRLTATQRWALGFSAPFVIGRGGSPRQLGGFAKASSPWNARYRPSTLDDHAGMLAKGWKIRTRDDVRKSLTWLRDEGHSREYEGVVAHARGGDGVLLAEHYRHFVREHARAIGERKLLAWDLGRLIDLAGTAAMLELIDDATAWSWILPAATRLQATYGSWEEYGRHVCLGQEFWNPKSPSLATECRALAKDT